MLPRRGKSVVSPQLRLEQLEASFIPQGSAAPRRRGEHRIPRIIQAGKDLQDPSNPPCKYQIQHGNVATGSELCGSF